MGWNDQISFKWLNFSNLSRSIGFSVFDHWADSKPSMKLFYIVSSSGRWLWFRVNPRVSRRHWRVFTIWRGPKPRQHSQPLPKMRCVLNCCLCHRFVCILENMGLPTKVALTSSIQRFSRSSVDPVQIWLQYAVIGNGFARLMMELGQEGNIVGAVESSVIRDPGRDAKIWYLTQIWLHVDIEFLYPLLLSAYVFLSFKLLK